MKSPKLVALVFVCALLSFAMPAAADDLTIDALAAVQYSYGYFIAYVSAHDSAPLIHDAGASTTQWTQWVGKSAIRDQSAERPVPDR